MIDPARIQTLNAHPEVPGKYVLYWMQASQRAVANPALEYAITRANQLHRPVVVGFGLMDDYPEANERHYAFMLQGLADVEGLLRKRGIKFVLRRGAPPEVALELSRDAAVVVCDRGYLRHQRRWRDELADRAKCQVVQVEGDVVVPVEAVSDKLEFAARTIRPKIQKLLPRFLKLPGTVKPEVESLALKIPGDLNAREVEKNLAAMKIDRSVRRTTFLGGGYRHAKKQLIHFVTHHLNSYAEGRRELSSCRTSLLAAYLHFGQISPVEVALGVQSSGAPRADREAFLEELIVRRELAMNYCFYNPAYDRFEGLPDWARQTLHAHSRDNRAYTYTRVELESAATHDPYWNAAQKQMIQTGYMHNMMRMYWGKKILEWKSTPQEAFGDALYLNNKYFLCGRDPASYANVGWLFGLHDRPWAKRPIFGTVRYMNASGLERKFDMEEYVRMVEEISEERQP